MRTDVQESTYTTWHLATMNLATWWNTKGELRRLCAAALRRWFRGPSANFVQARAA